MKGSFVQLRVVSYWLFWDNIGLFSENIGLFRENTGLFWENIGLFWENTGLVRDTTQGFIEKHNAQCQRHDSATEEIAAMIKQYFVMCCSVLQCAAVCCSVLQRGVHVVKDMIEPLKDRGMLHHNTLQRTATHSALQCVAMCCSALEHVFEDMINPLNASQPRSLNKKSHFAMCCNVL